MKKAPPRKAQFDLNEAIDEVIVLGRSAVIKNGVSVQTRLSEGLLLIHGDRVQLQQVVLNLLLNAVEAMGAVEKMPRDLLISTEQDHTGVLVAVRDFGPGLDPSHLERVFDAFHTTKSSGMGMGLSICRSIIDAHGGRLWAEANEPRGAIFQFTLPTVPWTECPLWVKSGHVQCSWRCPLCSPKADIPGVELTSAKGQEYPRSKRC